MGIILVFSLNLIMHLYYTVYTIKLEICSDTSERTKNKNSCKMGYIDG